MSLRPAISSVPNELNSLVTARDGQIVPGWSFEVALAYLEVGAYAIPDACRTLIPQVRELDVLCHTCIECS